MSESDHKCGLSVSNHLPHSIFGNAFLQRNPVTTLRHIETLALGGVIGEVTPMLKTRIIPCLDVKDGRVVKGVNFVDLVDAGDPVEQAKIYDAAGADELTFLDITASSDNRGTILDVAKRTAEQCFMPLTIGGGVRTVENIRDLLLAGADKVSINTAAVKDPDFVARASEKFGAQCIVVAIDAKTKQAHHSASPSTPTHSRTRPSPSAIAIHANNGE